MDTGRRVALLPTTRELLRRIFGTQTLQSWGGSRTLGKWIMAFLSNRRLTTLRAGGLRPPEPKHRHPAHLRWCARSEPRLDSSTVNHDRTPTVTRQPTAVSRQVPDRPDSNINREPDKTRQQPCAHTVKHCQACQARARQPDSPTARQSRPQSRQPDSPAHNPDSPTAPPTSPTALPTIPTAPPTIWTRDSGQQAVSMHPCS